MNQLKAVHEAYNEKYRFKHFQSFQSQVSRHQLTNKEFDKVNFEEGMQNVKTLRTNLIYEAHECQLYEGSVNEEQCLVKIEQLNNFLKKYHVKDLSAHLKMVFAFKCSEHFVQLLKCYTVQNKIFIWLNANKSWPRLSCMYRLYK